jgi:radical SAM protein with 4Fe4S-binding SPASM domain
MRKDPPVRSPTRPGDEQPRPIYVVWEVTLSCNLKCIHCGSRAGPPRDNELSTEECLSIIKQLAELGTREITLIGGEAYLRRDWLSLIKEISNSGILCGLQTGARALTEEKIAQAADAGLHSAGVSIDGLRSTHDRLRGVRGSLDTTLRALRNFRKYGLTGTVNTQINNLNVDELRELMRTIIAEGATGWQLALTVPMGSAADRPELGLQPFQLVELMPRLAELFVEAQSFGMRLLPGNNIGYFGPYESMWRTITGKLEHFNGCNAGQTALGIESDGSIKGCPSLPTDDYVGGNVRTTSIRELWERSGRVGFMRDPSIAQTRLWGYCRVCYYASVCQAGCTWTSHVISARPGNNPFCHYRALQLQKRGWREHLIPVEKPRGRPFDFGRFEIVIEGQGAERFGQEIFDSEEPDGPNAPLPLVLCGSCSQLIYTGERRCPHCAANIDSTNNTVEISDAAAYDATISALYLFRNELSRLRTLTDEIVRLGPLSS